VSYGAKLAAVAETFGSAIKEVNKLMTELKAMPVRSPREQDEINDIQKKLRNAERTGNGDSDLSQFDEDERLERAAATLERAGEMFSSVM
jgi:hypothetical protein